MLKWMIPRKRASRVDHAVVNALTNESPVRWSCNPISQASIVIQQTATADTPNAIGGRLNIRRCTAAVEGHYPGERGIRSNRRSRPVEDTLDVGKGMARRQGEPALCPIHDAHQLMDGWQTPAGSAPDALADTRIGG